MKRIKERNIHESIQQDVSHIIRITKLQKINYSYDEFQVL